MDNCLGLVLILRLAALPTEAVISIVAVKRWRRGRVCCGRDGPDQQETAALPAKELPSQGNPWMTPMSRRQLRE